MSTAFRQDMPPAGGYAPIHYDRVPTKKIITGWWLLGFTAVSSVFGAYRYWQHKYYRRKLEVEHYDTYNAISPFIMAEKDRLYLKQLRKLRDTERELMKDHPGWVVGTLYGEPVYKTLPVDRMPPVTLGEWYVHRPFWEFNNYAMPHLSQW